MQIVPTELEGVVIVEPKVFADPRGLFLETWNAERYAEAGLPAAMVQDNLSSSARGVLRGLHYQSPEPQGKLVYVLAGAVLDVAVDIRFGSPTFGRWTGVELSADNHRQLFVPAGFAHGFCATSEQALVAYKCTHPYRPQYDRGVAWNDPEIGIRWPTGAPLLSEKDSRAPWLSDIPAELLPRWTPAETARLGCKEQA
ncbi:MAG TPA: dTDP-4-dehydrorhamnose 3,5-epimerase [Pirellulales bacterium]|nr:dTDP-4-dehydrorhamnose 3,5-epimerase [Pirellulales bacterium]